MLSCLAKWTIPCILLLALIVERRWLDSFKRYDKCPPKKASSYYWRPKSITSNNASKQIYLPLEGVETAILGTIFLNMDRAYHHLHSQVYDAQEVEQQDSSAADDDRDAIITWTFLKHPHARTKDDFFRQYVSWLNVEPTITNYEKHALSCEEDVYFSRVLTSLGTTNETTKETQQRRILSSVFDFIGITERLDESLIVMKLLFDLQVSDLLYISVPDDLLDFNETHCVFLEEPFQYENEGRVINNPDYQKRIQNDLNLYQAANQKLDRTIDKLGRETVYQELQDYVQLLQKAHEACYDSAIFPCSLDGERQQNHSCLNDDMGCNYKCLDKFINRRTTT
jgi:hypothetical protein